MKTKIFSKLSQLSKFSFLAMLGFVGLAGTQRRSGRQRYPQSAENRAYFLARAAGKRARRRLRNLRNAGLYIIRPGRD